MEIHLAKLLTIHLLAAATADDAASAAHMRLCVNSENLLDNCQQMSLFKFNYFTHALLVTSLSLPYSLSLSLSLTLCLSLSVRLDAVLLPHS